jgi:hypothetical protein
MTERARGTAQPYDDLDSDRDLAFIAPAKPPVLTSARDVLALLLATAMLVVALYASGSAQGVLGR